MEGRHAPQPSPGTRGVKGELSTEITNSPLPGIEPGSQLWNLLHPPPGHQPWW
ncbi:hypothetical protein LOK49_LG06G00924 [Camellia lanceoleosa]|uniref:Uncharacterized protein n=1 Tax=Camellia lanceoleosa TaxID=1840588 RepID=A0ACC0HC65_9ERIC|nr:hypothetical protein LOK49_LG06G00924 [Camellia lanceoleosa]